MRRSLRVPCADGVELLRGHATALLAIGSGLTTRRGQSDARQTPSGSHARQYAATAATYRTARRSAAIARCRTGTPERSLARMERQSSEQ